MWTIFITLFLSTGFMVARGGGVGVQNDGLRKVSHSFSGRIIKGHIDVGIHLRHLHRNR